MSFTQRIGNKGQIVISFRQDPRTSESAYRERTETPNPGLPDVPEIPDVPPTIDRPGTGYVFVEKLAQAAFSRRFNNNTLSLLFFYQDQSDFQARGPDDIPPGNQSQIGTVLGWNMILGPKTTLFADISWVDRDFTGDDEVDDLFGGNLRISHELGRRTSLDAYYRRSQRTGSDNVAFDYTENQLGISVTREF